MEKEVRFAEGVTVKKEGKELVFTKEGKEARKRLHHPLINISIGNESVIIKTKKDNRNLKRLMNTYASHINNLIQGMITPYVYKLKIAGSHFPITVKVEGRNVLISNYLGEKVPRRCRIVGNTSVKVEGDTIIVESASKEDAGMTAGIIEKTGQISFHDRRTFQDGIYIIEKAGKKL